MFNSKKVGTSLNYFSLTQFARAALSCLALTFSLNAVAADGSLGQTKYVVFTGDINADGQNDVLMKAMPSLLMVPFDDIDIPLAISPRTPTFALVSTSYGNYTLVVNPDAATVGRAPWVPGSQVISYFGAEGDMSGSMSIRAATGEQASFVVSMLAAGGTLRLSSVVAPAINNPPPGGTLPACD